MRQFELPRFAQGLETVKERGGIAIKGQTASGKSGTVMPEVATSDPAEALDGAEVVKITCPVFGHETFMTTLAHHFQDGQIIIGTAERRVSAGSLKKLTGKGLPFVRPWESARIHCSIRRLNHEKSTIIN